MKKTNMSLLSSRALLLTATAATLALSSTVISKPAFAATATSNLDVSASVTNNCSISTGALAFGSYDPTSGSPATATGTVATTCTQGASATITLDQGANAGPGSSDAAPLRRLTNGANNLSYELFQDAARTTVWGNTGGTGVGITGNGTAQDTTVYGRILPVQNVPAGAYLDTVTATVTF